MNKEMGIITDPNFRHPPSAEELAYRQYRAQRLKQAEKLENERLEQAYQNMVRRERKIKIMIYRIKQFFRQ